jgi:hypothetical protein
LQVLPASPLFPPHFFLHIVFFIITPSSPTTPTL